MDWETIPFIKHYKSITKTDIRLRHAIDAADLITTIDENAPMKMEHGVLYGSDPNCVERLEHASNGRMIVTAVYAIISPPMALPPDIPPMSPHT